ncbi:MAG: hypothetical protein M3N41_14510 [Acidobacteriota bacterium]|nr:hypothetical protein [Acidobacteriota bacterium]
MPAYNAADTLRMNYAESPHDADPVIVVDEGGSGQPADIARKASSDSFTNQKTDLIAECNK